MDAKHRNDNTGEPDARKRARPVRRGAGGKGPCLRYLACGLPDKNLTDALYKVLQQHQRAIEQRLAQAERDDSPVAEDGAVDSSQQNVAGAAESEGAVLADGRGSHPSAADRQRQRRAEEAQHLHHRGWTAKEIAAHLQLSTKTIGRYLNASLPLVPVRRSRSGHLLTPYKAHLLTRWNEGCHNATRLFREIQAQGFQGQLTIVRDFIRELRRASGLPLKARKGSAPPLTTDPTISRPTLRALAHLAVRDLDALDPLERRHVVRLGEVHPALASALDLGREFTTIVRQHQVASFDAWLEKAAKVDAPAIRNFAASLQRDYAAVRAALELPWSNGPTEGYINRLKCLKRQMDGRAKLDLLRCRLLAA